MINDYSINFTPEQYEGDPVATANVKGRLNKANFVANRQSESLESIKEYLASGVSIWDVPCVRDFYIEAKNKQVEYEEESDEEIKENAQVLETLSTSLTDTNSNLNYLHKDFSFFIEEEKKEIKKAKILAKARQMSDYS